MATAKKTPAKKKPVGKVARDPNVLSDLEQRFCQEYQIDQNATQAYLRVKPSANAASARVTSCRLLAKTNIQAELARLRTKVEQETGINAKRVIEEAWAIATADPRELMEHRVGCCRYCWGTDHRYQFTTAEFEDAKAEHEALQATISPEKRRKLGKFNPKGGPGYDRRAPPKEDCPHCGGEGEGRVVFKDTRYISQGAASLFAGAKEGKEGREIKLHSKDAAIDKLFRHFGIYNDKLTLTMPTAIVKDMTGRKQQ